MPQEKYKTKMLTHKNYNSVYTTVIFPNEKVFWDE